MRLAESENVELKKSTGELKAGIISLAAMLNKHQRGGDVFTLIKKAEKYILEHINIVSDHRGLV